MGDLLTWIRHILIQAAICVTICGTSAYAIGKTQLIVPVITGCIIGVAYWIIIGQRIFKVAELSAEQAKRTLKSGFVIRWMILLVVLNMAGRISGEVFLAVAAGLLLIFVLMMVNIIFYAYRN